SEARLAPVLAQAGLSETGVERFGGDYADTLAEWAQRFEGAWTEIARRSAGFDERFRRLWRFYLAYCEAGFRSGRTDVIQMSLSRE
ncbi:MAG: class I SAM-dependent methyltransferase, partial [Brevundimonas sp.]